MRKIFIKILTIILTIIIIFTNIYISITKSISPTSIKINISNNLLSGFIYDNNGDKTDIFNTLLKLTMLDEDTVIKIMENDTADKIITDIVNSIYDYNLTGDSSYKYTDKEIIEILEDNVDKIIREINYDLNKYDKEYVINYTKDNIQYILDTIYNTNIGDYKHD